MISTKKHFEEYKGFFEENAVKTFDGLEDAANHFAKDHNVSTDVARERIKNNTNADWIVCPDGKVYVL
ncbi:hypothetical protein ACQKCU_26425 [Heyndrickxia sporothermodurans]